MFPELEYASEKIGISVCIKNTNAIKGHSALF